MVMIIDLIDRIKNLDIGSLSDEEQAQLLNAFSEAVSRLESMKKIEALKRFTSLRTELWSDGQASIDELR